MVSDAKSHACYEDGRRTLGGRYEDVQKFLRGRHGVLVEISTYAHLMATGFLQRFGK